MKRNFAAHYGPWAFVAGGSKGLGGAWCDALASRGLNIVLTGRRVELLEKKAHQLKTNHGVDVLPLSIDLASENLLDRVQHETDNLDIGFLVYNAGLADLARFTNQSLGHELMRLYINCRGPVILSHYFGNMMIEKERGGIVLMSSIGGLMGNPYNVGYSASKAFDIKLAEGLWYEFKDYNVDVIGCIAGLTKTHDTIAEDTKAQGGKAMEASDVVEETLAKLGSGPTMVPGRGNRRLAFLLKTIMPAKSAIEMMGDNYKKLWPDQIVGGI